MICEKVIREKFKEAIEEPKGLLGLLNQLFGQRFTKFVESSIFKRKRKLIAKLRGNSYEEIE